MNELKNQVSSFLEDFFVKREGVEVLEYYRTVDYVDAGYLDSLDILELATLLELKFNLKIDFSNTQQFEAMRSFSGIIDVIVG
jgi:acyl carrier protein